MIAACAVLLFVSGSLPAAAAERNAERPWSAVSLRWENDAFGGTDANYTNGMSLAVTTTGSGLIGRVWDVAGPATGSRFSSYDVGQLQFTPSNLDLSTPDPNDRPYAGFLYLGVTSFLQRADSMHGIKLFAGVLGPLSQSEEAQSLSHHILGDKKPEGWGHQLKNEPILNFLYEYRHRFRLTPPESPFGIEFIPAGGAMLGNFLIQSQVSGQIRAGYRLPDDFGTTVLRGLGFLPFPREADGRPEWGFYTYAGGGASFVAWNVTLDGNTFARSPSVDKRLFLPAIEFGATIWTRRFQATFSYVMMGREFYGQPEREDYGSILFSWFFG